MGTQKTLNKKIDWFKEAFAVAEINEITIGEEKLIASFCLDMYSTERKAKEIIKMFEKAGKISRVGGMIEILEKTQEQGLYGQ
jgi:hypothetical protein